MDLINCIFWYMIVLGLVMMLVSAIMLASNNKKAKRRSHSATGQVVSVTNMIDTERPRIIPNVQFEVNGQQ